MNLSLCLSQLEVCREKFHTGLDILAIIAIFPVNSSILCVHKIEIIREFNSHRYYNYPLIPLLTHEPHPIIILNILLKLSGYW
jgi:hypothetical protein